MKLMSGNLKLTICLAGCHAGPLFNLGSMESTPPKPPGEPRSARVFDAALPVDHRQGSVKTSIFRGTPIGNQPAS
jgi:hypothetical protein